VSSTSRAGSYRDVLLLPNALRTFAPALLGRLSYGLLPLSTLSPFNTPPTLSQPPDLRLSWRAPPGASPVERVPTPEPRPSKLSAPAVTL
jgi:hypothetical protein